MKALSILVTLVFVISFDAHACSCNERLLNLLRWTCPFQSNFIGTVVDKVTQKDRMLVTFKSLAGETFTVATTEGIMDCQPSFTIGTAYRVWQPYKDGQLTEDEKDTFPSASWCTICPPYQTN